VEEVENALYDLAGEHERIKHPEVAARSAKEAADAALQQYETPCCSRFIEYPPSASGS
jgi:outer membrane protein TolC